MKNTLVFVSAVLMVGVFAFFVGTRVQRQSVFSGFYGRQFAPQIAWMHGWGMGIAAKPFRGILQGQIGKIENNTITLQLPNGGTYTITIDERTEVGITTQGSKEDLKTGQNIMVFGGSLFNTAQTIFIYP